MKLFPTTTVVCFHKPKDRFNVSAISAYMDGSTARFFSYAIKHSNVFSRVFPNSSEWC